MRPRSDERDALHGPWPTEAEILAGEFPHWEIWRERRDDGTHGDWCAQLGSNPPLKAASLSDLREQLMAQP
ncbi:hypothetical protein [Streptomonospora nanhaiensis]|uniref:Uncharacterized protein n=1 Tax=Streptomonospora nanhaiensis TaxID=1323731 RepID=A0A853BUV0_9ACTN|nr:hypothetical protein [Streptomonospora nanhaiensis]MBV2366198.1 hypothetical protein [Streptomonospora nanhaiensis]NYI98287.1 hypothetical protein [Streptomonospora nanhaiensis]